MTDTPSITANLLAEYCYATAARRSRILELMQSDQFEPFKKWYGEVPGAYRRFLATGSDDSALATLEAALVRREAASEDEENKILCQLDAIEHIRQIDHSSALSGAEVLAYSHPARSTEISGVRVRVNPTNLVLTERLGHKDRFIGIVKPYLRKSRELPNEEALTFASILHWFAERELPDLGTASHDQCIVTDVFAERLIGAPRAFKRRRDLVTANCVEIAERWPAIRAKASSSRPRAAEAD